MAGRLKLVRVDKLSQFEANRARLFGLAYRMLGEASEAEDVVQDAYLRWERGGEPEVPEAWLTKIVTNLCLTRLSSARARRERYLGPWLPEPLLIDTGRPGPLELAEQRDTLSYGLLVLLERLSPPERAAFVLREAFGYRHREIAEVLDITEEHARQLHRRARVHVGQPRGRFPADKERSRRIAERFMAASCGGDVEALERLLVEDVVAWSDGGGVIRAARRPVIGRPAVVRFLSGIARLRRASAVRHTIGVVNGGFGVLVHQAGELITVTVPEIAGDRIVAIRSVLNPAKLAHAAKRAPRPVTG